MIDIEALARHPLDYRVRHGMRAVVRRFLDTETAVMAALMVSVISFSALLAWDANAMPPVSAFAPFVVLGGLFLRPLCAFILFVTIMAGVVIVLWRSPLDVRSSVLPVAGQLSIMSFMMWVSESRSRLGVLGMQGESMLVDLRDRLRRAGEMPELPAAWFADLTVQSAGGAKFAGDFVNTALTEKGSRLEVALVDVSGKGAGAGTRALLLSGAMGGLLGAMPPEQFLPAANAYLLRQQWPDGFATCVHVAIDLTTGDYSIGTAGHPPTAHHEAAKSRWTLVKNPMGPLLGVLEEADFPRTYGRLGAGDVLLAYTDGVVETRDEDLEAGIDRMLHVAEQVRASGRLEDLGQAVCAAARSGDSDDRAAVVLARR